MAQKYLVINETDARVKHGGACMTLQALLEPRADQIEYLWRDNLGKLEHMDQDEYIYILGNVHGCVPRHIAILDKVLRKQRFVDIQFDYVWCQFRSEIAHGMNTNKKCQCPINNSQYDYLWRLQVAGSRHHFFMSEEQRKIYKKHSNYEVYPANSSILSSAFMKDHLELYRKLRATTEKNDRFAVIDGGMDEYGSYCKGIDVSTQYAQDKGIPLSVLMGGAHEDMMRDLAQCKGLIFLPRNHDTCPRIVIEARLLGLMIVLNSRVQHVHEKWWLEGDVDSADRYISGRPEFFWKKVDEVCAP